MKLFITIVIFIIFFSNSDLSAQFYKNCGIKAGAARSTHDWYSEELHQYPENSWGYGFTMVVFAEKFKFKDLSLITEIAYTQKNSNYKKYKPYSPELKYDNSEVANRFDYLSLALMPKLKYEILELEFYFLGGPRFDYLINKNIELEIDDVFNHLKKYTYGINIGWGIEYNKNLPFTFIIEAIGCFDLKNSIEIDYYYSNYFQNKVRIKNSSVQFKIGFKF